MTGGRALQEKPPQYEICALQLESSPRSPQLGEACSNEDLAEPKINKHAEFLKKKYILQVKTGIKRQCFIR